MTQKSKCHNARIDMSNGYYECDACGELCTPIEVKEPETEGGWISTNTPPELPPKECGGHRYWGWIRNGLAGFSSEVHYTSEGLWMLDGAFITTDDLTHYMPLPKKPKRKL